MQTNDWPEVLFIDDGTASDVVAAYLIADGFDVRRASGTDAVNAFRRRMLTTETVILGLDGRAEMNGLGLLHAMRSVSPHVSAVFMTGAPLNQLLLSGATSVRPRVFRRMSDLSEALLFSCGRS